MMKKLTLNNDNRGQSKINFGADLGFFSTDLGTRVLYVQKSFHQSVQQRLHKMEVTLCYDS